MPDDSYTVGKYGLSHSGLAVTQLLKDNWCVLMDESDLELAGRTGIVNGVDGIVLG